MDRAKLELVSANSGRRHYRYVAEHGTRDIRIRHDRHGWRYRLDDDEESMAFSSMEQARFAAIVACDQWSADVRSWTGLDQRVLKGVPRFPGDRSRLHGVTLEWEMPAREDANEEDARRYTYTAATHAASGTIILTRDQTGAWRYRFKVAGRSDRSASTYPDAEQALDAATRVFYREAKRAAKRTRGEAE